MNSSCTVEFSFSINAIKGSDKYREVFSSPSGEEYIVHFQPSESYSYAFGRQEIICNLTIEWKSKGNKIIRVTSYNSMGQQENKKEKIVEKNVLAKFNDIRCYKNDSHGSIYSIIVINIIPYTDIPKCNVNKMLSDGNTSKSMDKEPIVEKKFEEVSNDLKNILQKGELSDIVLTDGSTEIKAHKLILSVRSSVFAKMFQHPMKENRENRITIKDIRIDILKALLDFLYSGTAVLKNQKMARDLYIAADKYDVQSLKNICSKMLSSVDFNNVIDTLLLADLYSDKKLKEAALNFIARNYSQVKTLGSWSDFMKKNQTLAIEILGFVLDKN